MCIRDRAITSTLFIVAIGYPFGYFMAKLSPAWKKRMMLLLMIPFWTSSLIRMYGWIIIFRANGTPVSYTHLDVYKRQV